MKVECPTFIDEIDKIYDTTNLSSSIAKSTKRLNSQFDYLSFWFNIQNLA